MIIKLAILLVIVLIVAGFAFVGRSCLPRYLPRQTVARHLRIRLHLRLHPGKGFRPRLQPATLRWSRFAVLRRSSQIRPALPWRYSLLDPAEHSVVSSAAPSTGTACGSRWREHLLVMGASKDL